MLMFRAGFARSAPNIDRSCSNLPASGPGVGFLRLVAFGLLSEVPVAQGVGLIRVDPEGLVVVLNCAVILAFGTVSAAPVVEGTVVIRVEPDLVQVLNGTVVLVLANVGAAPVGEVLGAIAWS